MSRLEEYLRELSGGLHANASERDSITEELRSHAEECKLEFLARGYSEEKAEELVIKRLGPPQEIIRNFDAVYRRKSLSLLLDLFHRENTIMHRTVLETLDWVATIAMGGIGAACFCVTNWFFLPRTEVLFRETEAEPAGLVTAFMSVSGAIDRIWPILAIVLVLSLAVFLWRYKGDLKKQIAKSAVTVGSAVLVFLGAVGLIASLLPFTVVVGCWR